MENGTGQIALVHDYFTQRGGAERVAEELYFLLGKPTVYTTVALPELLPPGLSDARIQTSWMQRLPWVKNLHRAYFPLYPLGVADLDLTPYDVVVSSSSSYAKGVLTRPNAVHICYCHTPTRWVWRYKEYAERESFGLPQKFILPSLISGLKLWDCSAARQPDLFVANSQAVAERIRKYYEREAIVIPPPINIDRFRLAQHQEDYYLVLARLVSYKRIDLAISACNRLGRRLVIVGDGPDRKRLQSMAGSSVTFAGRLSDSEVNRVAGRCRALLFPGEEDFGMTPLELAAAGRPTIALRAGGALETIVEGTTGLFFDKSDPDDLANAILESERLHWNPRVIREHAARFDVAVFRSRFHSLLLSVGINVSANVLEHSMTEAAAV